VSSCRSVAPCWLALLSAEKSNHRFGNSKYFADQFRIIYMDEQASLLPTEKKKKIKKGHDHSHEDADASKKEKKKQQEIRYACIFSK
jgi:hypothetical protein